MKETKMNENEKEVDIVKTVLDAYFSTRCPNGSMLNSVVDDKTTQDIIDDLQETLSVTDEEVVKYMVLHGYMLTNAADGTPVWRIYRMR